ncbi:MAG: hypothetical protein Ct9H90mP27_6700 [Gammaproteobacteria bacterium]|nr:MAG: hypothetical protein Ct9H90mP27_6700 [Gammaproteobacteria bacterium]
MLAKPLEDPNIKWAHDLIGNLVIDNEGNQRGLIVEIHANPASDLLVLEDETLIPVVFLKDIKDNKVFVDTPKVYSKIVNHANRYSDNFSLSNK